MIAWAFTCEQPEIGASGTVTSVVTRNLSEEDQPRAGMH
jgi:hypothetical protein